MFGKFIGKLRNNFEEISNKYMLNFLKHLREIMKKLWRKKSFKKFEKFYKNISFRIVGNVWKILM